jgi:hypothetical protein
MNIKVVANSAGIFAKVILVLQTVKKFCDNKKINLDVVNNIYLESKPNGLSNNLFDYVFDQEDSENYDVTLSGRKYKTYNRMFEDGDLPFFREMFKKLKIKDSVIDRVDKNINENTLGVHVRLTDMNSLHGRDYGVRNFHQYLNKVESVTKTNNPNNIFVSSDNIISIQKLSEKYDIIYNNEICNRHNSEVDNGDYNNFLRNNHLDEQFWVDSFVDMLSLAKCGEMVKGVSSLSNTSIVVSECLKKVYYV